VKSGQKVWMRIEGKSFYFIFDDGVWMRKKEGTPVGVGGEQ